MAGIGPRAEDGRIRGSGHPWHYQSEHDQTPGHSPDPAHLPGGMVTREFANQVFDDAAINLAAAQQALGECGSNYLLLVLGTQASPSKETHYPVLRSINPYTYPLYSL
jgi:hypothetical protein